MVVVSRLRLRPWMSLDVMCDIFCWAGMVFPCLRKNGLSLWSAIGSAYSIARMKPLNFLY